MLIENTRSRSPLMASGSKLDSSWGSLHVLQLKRTKKKKNMDLAACLLAVCSGSTKIKMKSLKNGVPIPRS